MKRGCGKGCRLERTNITSINLESLPRCRDSIRKPDSPILGYIQHIKSKNKNYQDSCVVGIRLYRLWPTGLRELVPHGIGSNLEPVESSRLKRAITVSHLVVTVLCPDCKVFYGCVGERVVGIGHLENSNTGALNDVIKFYFDHQCWSSRGFVTHCCDNLGK